MTNDVEPRLEERLRRLAAGGAHGDWLDVRRRVGLVTAERRTRRRRRLVAAAATVAALVVVASVPAFGVADKISGLFAVSKPGKEEVPRPPGRVAPIPYVYGDTLFGYAGGPQKLGGALLAPLLGQDAPLAVKSPDGRFIAYHTAPRPDLPVLRVHDVATGRDFVLARGAQTVAWRDDPVDAVAYWRAVHPRYRPGPYLGRVLVRSSPRGRPEAWISTPGVYRIVAWAGPHLLVESTRCAFPACNRLPVGAFSLAGPSRMHRLPLTRIAAVSPDGRYAFGQWLPSPTQDSPSPHVRVVDLASRKVVVHLNLARALRRAGGQAVLGSIGSADWSGSRIVAVSYLEGATRLVVLRFAGRRLAVERVIRLDRTIHAGYGTSFSQPTFLSASDRRVVVRLVIPYASGARDAGYVAFLTCDLVTERCLLGRRLPERRWLALVVALGPEPVLLGGR